MIQLRYMLRIDVNRDRLSSDVIHAIHTDAASHDQTFVAMLQRYLGGPLDDAADQLADELPEGFAVTVEEAPTGLQVHLS